MDDDHPDPMQTSWIFRGTTYIVGGLSVLVCSLFLADRAYYLFGGLACIGLGTWDMRLAISSMADDKTRRLTSPARVQHAEEGLTGAGWQSSANRRNERTP